MYDFSDRRTTNQVNTLDNLNEDFCDSRNQSLYDYKMSLNTSLSHVNAGTGAECSPLRHAAVVNDRGGCTTTETQGMMENTVNESRR